jgi:hypothetical protein
MRFPPGHFYSPVPDPIEARAAIKHAAEMMPGSLAGIDIDEIELRDFWDFLASSMADAPFPETRTDRFRYYYQNDFYSYGDALVYFAMIRRFQPRRIIEIGSGFTSAVVLDTRDFLQTPLHLTCIEPNPGMLNSLLRESDKRQSTLIQSKAQDVDPAIVENLEANDFLFIDSSHVLKIGSDVCFELFELLPRLKPGVWVHFHDVFWPFEYPVEWVEKGVEWNELYALRAFLTHNSQFKIRFFNHLFAIRHYDLLKNSGTPAWRNPGGALWVQRQT